MSNFVPFAAFIAELAHGEKSHTYVSHSINHAVTHVQLIWFAGNRSFRFGIAYLLFKFIQRYVGIYSKRLLLYIQRCSLSALCLINRLNSTHPKDSWSKWIHKQTTERRKNTTAHAGFWIISVHCWQWFSSRLHVNFTDIASALFAAWRVIPPPISVPVEQ